MPRSISLSPQRKVTNDPTTQMPFDIAKYLQEYPFDPAAAEQAIIDAVNDLVAQINSTINVDLNNLFVEAANILGLLTGGQLEGLDASKIISGQFAEEQLQKLIDSLSTAFGGGAGLDFTGLNSLIASLPGAQPLIDAIANALGHSGTGHTTSDILTYLGLIPGGNIASPVAPSVIPGLDGSKITGGQIAQAFLNITNVAATWITGTLDKLNIPKTLDTSWIPTGTWPILQIPTVDSKITNVDGSKIQSGLIGQAFLNITSIATSLLSGIVPIAQIPTVDSKITNVDGSKIQSGLISQSFLNITNIAAGIVSGTLDKLNIPKTLDNTWIPSAVWPIAQIPVVDSKINVVDGSKVSTGSIPIPRLPDLQALQDAITQYIFPTAPPGSALGSATDALVTHWQATQDNTQAIADMQSASQAAAQSGISITCTFGDYPSSAEMPNPADLSNPAAGGWVSTYNTIPGGTYGIVSPVGGVKGGGPGAIWKNYVAPGPKTVVTHHPTPTVTGFQAITLHIPQDTTANQGAIWIVGRCNAANTEYVGAKFYTIGTGSYAVDLGWVNSSGVFTSWSGQQLGISSLANVQLLCGTGGVNARKYQVWAGSSKIVDLTEPGSLSPYDAAHQFWGIRSDVSGTIASGSPGTYNSGQVSYIAANDTAPPSVIGSGSKMARTSTSTVSAVSGPALLPANFFDSLQGSSPDITSTVSNGRHTVTVSGWYMVSGAIQPNANTYTTNFALALYRNGSIYRMGGGAYEPALSLSASWVAYLNAGDYVQLGYYAGSTLAVTIKGEAAGAYSYFDIALINKSLA